MSKIKIACVVMSLMVLGVASAMHPEMFIYYMHA